MADEKALTVASLGDTVREKVRLAMMNAIPDASMDALIQGEFKAFFEDTKEYNSIKPSPFKQLVQNEIRKQMGEGIISRVQSAVNGLLDEKDENGQVTKDIVAMVTPAVFETMMGTVANQVVGNLRQQIQNGRNW